MPTFDFRRQSDRHANEEPQDEDRSRDYHLFCDDCLGGALVAVVRPAKDREGLQEEWRANRAANQAAGITQKAYVEKCRAGTAPTQAAPAAPAQPAPARPAATTTAPPPAPAAQQPSTARPAARTTPAPTIAVALRVVINSAPRRRRRRAARPDTVVWVNINSKIYHFTGYSDYGKTKKGAYMCERDATGGGFRAAKNEKHP